jgi:hypothetical protein
MSAPSPLPKGKAKTTGEEAVPPGGIVRRLHQRGMTAPRVLGQVAVGETRPGQAGPEPGDFFHDHGGPVITNVRVVPMFWGSAWNDNLNPNPSVLQVYAGLASIVSGPYMSGLAQYRGVGTGQILLESGTRENTTEPPNPFNDSNISKLVGDAINAGTVPAPNALPGNQYLYTVFLPPGINPTNGAGGEHTYFNLNGTNVHFAWVTHGGGIDSITDLFSHELAEACTDPEGSAFTFDSQGDPGYGGWIEIGDVCEAYSARLNNVEVQAYWSQKDRACIVPTLSLAPIPRWYRLGNESITHGILNGGLALAVDGKGQMHLFARGVNADMLELRESFDPTWGSWSSMGGGILPDTFSVAVNGDGRLEVFALGVDNAIWHNWETSAGGSWSGWNSTGGVGVGVPRAVRNANGQLEVFVVGSDSAVWHIKQAGSLDWGKAWTSLGGKVLTGLFVPPILDVIPNGDGRLEVFAQGTDAGLYHIWQNAPNGSTGWSAWARIGGVISLLSLARGGDGRLAAFVRGGDSALYMIEQAGSLDWGGAFTRMGGSMAGTSFSAGTNADGRLEVFWQGSDGSAQHIWQPNPHAPPTGWSGIASLGGGIQKIKVANNGDGRFELAVIGMDSYAYHIWQTAPSNGWNY